LGRPSRYPEEFRREAVQLALSSDESRAAVARRLGVNETTLRNWVAAQRAEEARQADPLAVTPSEFEELRRLRREVAELRTEREILRKAAAYFAQDDPVCRFGFVAEHRSAYGGKRLCRVLGVPDRGSTGGRAAPYDNAAVEAFFATLKREPGVSTTPSPGLRAAHCGPHCSTASKASTTPNASSNDSASSAPSATNNLSGITTRVHQTGSTPMTGCRTEHATGVSLIALSAI
jgi:transposase